MHVTCENQRYDWERLVKKDHNVFDEVLVKDSALAKRITWTLVTLQIPFRKINYGCGVLLFVPNNKKICKNCNGKGTV